VNEANETQCQQFLATPRDALLESKYESRSINDTIDQYLKSMALDTKVMDESSKPQFETVKRFSNAKDVIGYLEQIVCKGIPVPQINCEIAIPLEHTYEATLAIKSWANKNKKRLHYPFIYRAIGQSKAWLNSSYKGAVCYVGFLVYVAEDGSVREDGMTTMRELQTILAPFGGMPHWGKHFLPDVYDFERLVPKWKDFLDLRAQIDPKKKMLSAFLENIFKLTDTHSDE
jgi:hypothetical protein